VESPTKPNIVVEFLRELTLKMESIKEPIAYITQFKVGLQAHPFYVLHVWDIGNNYLSIYKH
jgi:hypothetical protein